MPYVYRYVDVEDGVTKYVGIVSKDERLASRIADHQHDKLSADHIEWRIEYAHYDTVCDVQALEGHLIELYQTYNYYNEAKQNWGLCSFAPAEIDWKEWDGAKTFNAEMKLQKAIQNYAPDPYIEEKEQKSIPVGIPEMLSLRETARRTGLSYDALRNMCLNGKIAHVRCGTKFLINCTSLVSMLNEKG